MNSQLRDSLESRENMDQRRPPCTLMDLLCGREDSQSSGLSENEQPCFLSFNQKPIDSSEPENEGFRGSLMNKRSARMENNLTIVRVIPVSELQAENMRRLKQPKSQLITSFSQSKFQASALRENHVLVPKT